MGQSEVERGSAPQRHRARVWRGRDRDAWREEQIITAASRPIPGRAASWAALDCAHEPATEATACLYEIAFEALPDAVWVAAEDGGLIAANGAARRSSAHSEAVRIIDNRLHMRSHTLAQAVQACLSSGSAREAILTLSGAIMHARVARLADAAAPAAVVICISGAVGAAPAAQDPVERLCEVFHLTLSEATVASLLCQGKRVRDIAVLRQVSEHTVRAQLKSLFTKLGVRSQVEATALLCRLLAQTER